VKLRLSLKEPKPKNTGKN